MTATIQESHGSDSSPLVNRLGRAIDLASDTGFSADLRGGIVSCLAEFCPPTNFAVVLFDKTSFEVRKTISEGFSRASLRMIADKGRTAIESPHLLSKMIRSTVAGPAKCVVVLHGNEDIDRERFSVFCFLGNYDIETYLNAFRLISPYLHIALENSYHTAMLPAADRHALSARESEILRWVSLGKTNNEIAGVLVISVHTVKNHIANIFFKLGVKNRTQAVERARAYQYLIDQ